MTADAELAVAPAGAPLPSAVLEVLQAPVLVLGPRGQLLSANAAARHLLGDELERAPEGVLQSLARTAWQADRPVEHQLAATDLHRPPLRARATPLDGGVAVELAVTWESAEPTLAARLAQRIREDSTRLVRLVGGSLEPAEPEPDTVPAAPAPPGSLAGGAAAGRGHAARHADPDLPAAETTRLSAQDVTLDLAAHTAWVRGERVELPFKEFALLRLLLEQAGRVVPRQRLIECVWGRDFSGDPKTLDVHVKRLRAKLEVDRARPTRIVTVRQIGYRFELAG